MTGSDSFVRAEQVAAIARAFDIDPQDLRADTPLGDIGWTGSASDWLLAAQHLGVALADDPIDAAQARTIADVVAMVVASGR